MGGRVSVPRSPDKMSEASGALPGGQRKTPLSHYRRIGAPITLLLLGGVFFVYTRITVAAAKENVRRAREQDGGTINWRNESRRIHGSLERPEERTLFQQLFASKEEKDKIAQEEEVRRTAERKPPSDLNDIERGIWKAREERRLAIERARRGKE